MHICIPDTREVRPQHGSAYLLYNVHIDGLYHCSLRFKQLLHLHQNLSKKFSASSSSLLLSSSSSSSSSSSNGCSGAGQGLPPFPPKKLLPLSASRVEERRQQLEKYLQTISQDKTIANSTIFNMFLLEAQRESTRLVEPEKHVHLDIELVNGQKIRLPIVTHDSVDSVLTACCRALGLNDRYHAYFCLCLCGYDVVRDKLIIKRRLSFFEAPFITLQMAIRQQEQLQSVLSSGQCSQQQQQQLSGATSNMQPTTTTTALDSNNNYYERLTTATNISPATAINGTRLRYNDADLTPCRCLSCSSRQTQQVRQKQSTTTAVPSNSSSSNSQRNSPYANQQQSLILANGDTNTNYYHHNQNGDDNNRVWRRTRSVNSASPFVTHRILLRKSYWDPIYDSYILNDQQALNLLFIQTVYDMKHSLMFVDRDTYQQLESLLATDSKLEYILLARTLKYYNYVHFEPCYSDFPRPRTKVMISIGSKELNMRVLRTPKLNADASGSGGPSVTGSSSSTSASSSSSQLYQQASSDQKPVLYCTSSLLPDGHRHLITKEDLIEEEFNFKVPLIRCWRLTSLETLNSISQGQQHRQSATTTLAGGKRKSLSLFNSVVGSHLGPTSNAAAPRDGTLFGISSNETRSTSQMQGCGGQSLMAALSSNHQQTTERSSNTGANTSGGFFSSFWSPSNNTNADQGASLDRSCQPQHQETQQHNSLSNELLEPTQLSQYELSFEYLIAKDTLKWITISSDQAIFISISLQGVVDELVSRRELSACLGDMPTDAVDGLVISDVVASHESGASSGDEQIPTVSRPISIGQRHDRDEESRNQPLAESFTYMCQDGGQKLIKSKSQQMLHRFCAGNSPPSLAANYSLAMARHRRATSGGGPTYAVVSRNSNSLLQTAGYWSAGNHHEQSGSSPGGRHPFGRSGGSIGLSSNGSLGSASHSLEISHVNNKKIPSPIINDAFEGLVANDDDL